MSDILLGLAVQDVHQLLVSCEADNTHKAPPDWVRMGSILTLPQFLLSDAGADLRIFY